MDYTTEMAAVGLAHYSDVSLLGLGVSNHRQLDL